MIHSVRARKPSIVPAGANASAIQPLGAIRNRVRPFPNYGPKVLGLEAGE